MSEKLVVIQPSLLNFPDGHFIITGSGGSDAAATLQFTVKMAGNFIEQQLNHPLPPAWSSDKRVCYHKQGWRLDRYRQRVPEVTIKIPDQFD